MLSVARYSDALDGMPTSENIPTANKFRKKNAKSLFISSVNYCSLTELPVCQFGIKQDYEYLAALFVLPWGPSIKREGKGRETEKMLEAARMREDKRQQKKGTEHKRSK